MFSIDLNFEIPPNGYIIILSTSIPNILAVKKCPNSCTIIKKLTTMNGINEAVKMEIITNTYTKKSI